ncbi:MAG: hypothetical protein R3F36_16100 [Candidatus Competibacteraceae bacterium]
MVVTPIDLAEDQRRLGHAGGGWAEAHQLGPRRIEDSEIDPTGLGKRTSTVQRQTDGDFGDIGGQVTESDVKCLALRSDTLVQRQGTAGRARVVVEHEVRVPTDAITLAQEKSAGVGLVATGAFGFPSDADPKFRAAGQG